MMKAASRAALENAMKRILPLIVTAAVPPVAVVLVAALALLSTRASAAPETQAKMVSVDYVLALMDAGIDQREIVRRIVEKNLTFRMEPGDIGRLREAGAGKELVDVVTAEQDTSQWERPHRLGSAPSYGTYAPGYSSFTFSYGYPYPYYYDPYYPYTYYAPYGYHTYYSTPYYHYPGYSYRTAPRGSGSVRGTPRGGSVRSAPHGGGSPRSSPRGSHH
jgi:hypothetical protein